MGPQLSNSTSPIVANLMLSLLLMPAHPAKTKSGVTPPRLVALPTAITTTEFVGKLPDNIKSQDAVANPLL